MALSQALRLSVYGYFLYYMMLDVVFVLAFFVLSLVTVRFFLAPPFPWFSLICFLALFPVPPF